MSKAPRPPSHLGPIPVEIPASWTPEQALAVFDLLDEIREKIWAVYSCRLQDLLQEQQRSSGHDDDNSAITSNDRPDI